MQALKPWLNKIDAGLVLAGLLGLFVIQNLLQPGLPTVADLPIHLYRTLEFKEAWAPGVIVPRWAPNLAYGYGYPLFIFAPPLPYLLGLAFLWSGLSIEIALKLVIVLSILLYAGGMYLMARDILNSAAAGLVAAAAYLFAPFALREALLYGGNVPQLLAIGFFPWTLWAMAGTARHRSWGWIGLIALFYAAVLLSHLFQALVFIAVAGLYGLLLWGYAAGRAGRPIRPVGWGRYLPAAAPLLGLLLGLLLSAFFWLPAFIEREFTRAQASIYLEKSPFFVRYPHWPELIAWIQPLDSRAANPYVPLTLGVVTMVLAALGLVAALAVLLAGRDRAVPATDRLLPPARQALFFAAVAAGAALMTLPISRPLWETVSILQVAEFPWRTLGLVNLGLAFLAGYVLLLVPLKYRWPAAVVCLLALLLTVGPYLYPVTGFTGYGGVGLAEQVDYERRSQSIGTTTLGEYLPRSVEVVPTGSPMVESFLAGQRPERLDRATLPAGASATLREQNAVTYRYRLNSPAGFTLRLYQFAFPGWTARLDSEAANLPLSPEPETGLILVDVPAGQHTLTIHFGETPIRVAGLVVSGLTLLGLGLVGLVTRRARVTAGSTLENQPEKSARLPLLSPGVGVSLMLVLVAALWLKPLLRPVFTITSPPGRALLAQHETSIEFANGIRLIGYDLSRKVVPAGGYLQVVLYWETETAPMEANLQPFVHLDRLNDLVTVAANTNYTPGDPTTESNLPTFHWDNSRYVRDEHDLIVPPGTPPLAYAVRVGLIDPADQGRLVSLAGGSGDTAHLTTLNVSSDQPPARLAQSPAVTFTSDHGPIRLTGFEIDEIGEAQLDFFLAWQTEQRLPQDYTVFAQLLDAEGQLVASMDRPPLDGAYPTSTWLPGQTIIDRRSIPLAGVPPGDYRLIVGLYDPTNQQRLATTTGTDFAVLATINSGGSRPQLEPKK